jgi:hypothetical protein
MKYLVSIVLLLTLDSCALRSAPLLQQNRRLVDLQREKDKVRRTSDPVSKTKSHIVISEILLELTRDAARTGEMETLDQRLDEYVSTIREAHETMMRTGRDAHKSPKGFRELEIALRKQLKQLEDISDALTFDEREPVTKARDEATRLRDELLKALFGSQNAPSNM